MASFFSSPLTTPGLFNSLFGGGPSTPQISFSPSGISNPTGFSVSPKGAISNSPALSSNIGNLQSTFAGAANAFRNLASTVTPGFSQFRMAGLRDITNTFRANRSNLIDTLAQRRIFGSSFGNASLSQNAADEAEARANFEAKSYLQELSSSQQLVQQEFDAQSKSFSSAIDQSNIESSVAASLTASNNSIGAQIASANAQLLAQSQAGQGQLLGTLIGAGARVGAAAIMA